MADLLVFDKIIVEVKAKPKITGIDHAQVINYLRLSGNQVGLILNFHGPRLDWERVVLSKLAQISVH